MNNYGLIRSIPEEIRRGVRKRCNYSCIRCANPIIQYHHFNPKYENATVHDINGITLLCGSCHDMTTRGILSDAKIEELHNKRIAAIQEKVFLNNVLDFQSPFNVILSCLIFSGNFPKLITKDIEILYVTIDPYDKKLLLNLNLVDETGTSILEIKENELILMPQDFDLDFIGQKLIIKNKLAEKIIILKYNSPNSLIFEKIKWNFPGLHIDSDLKSYKLKLIPDSGINIDFNSGFVICKGQVVMSSSKENGIFGGSAIIPLRKEDKDFLKKSQDFSLERLILHIENAYKYNIGDFLKP